MEEGNLSFPDSQLANLFLGAIESELPLVDGKRGTTEKKTSATSLFPTAVLRVFHHPEKKKHKLSPFMMTSQVTLVLNI